MLSDIDSPEPEHYASTMDAIRKIKKKEGLSGLYAGMPGSLIGVASTNFAYFYWYTFVRTYYISVQAAQGNLSTVAELSLGAVAGALAQLFTIPVAVVTTRQQTSEKENRKDLITTAKDVIGEDGWTGLWSGLKASLVLVVNPAITYGAYQRCRETFYPGKKTLKPMEAFFLGALSKALATFATQPLIVAKVGLQSNPPAGQKKFKSFVEVMKYVIHHEGLLGLYKGISPQLMKGLLVQGLLMMTKERVELIFLLMYRWLIKKLGK
ncbi:ADP/ATP carrier protein, variant 2 [Orbilia oligospora]|nr:ADP/ATP carrier protein, variant 2 [Orbilia oligospora]